MRNSPGIQQIVGQSAWTLKLRKRILQIAGYNYNVLITGPAGAGKELIARAIHAHGPRSIKPFVRVNGAALPGELFARQVFGECRGTSGRHATLGCFRAADGGTLLLDEVGDLDIQQQQQLLAAIDNKTVTPVGGAPDAPVDVRIIATTDRNLDEDVRAGRFRLDLYYRLNAITLHAAPLRDRREDIPPLARHFLAKAAIDHGIGVKDLSDSAVDLLQNYDWPGNIREMRSLLERAALCSDAMMIGPDCFPDLASAVVLAPRSGGANDPDAPMSIAGDVDHGVAAKNGHGPRLSYVQPQDQFEPATTLATALADELRNPTAREAWPTLSDIERGHISRTLQETFFNQSAAARLLGINRKLLSRKIKKHGIRLPEKAG